jgi:hypothetical protein
MPIINYFDKMEWKNPPRGYYLTDVKEKTLYINKETGAKWALVKFPPGVSDRLHSHPKANQHGLLISGELEMPDGTLRPANATFTFEKGEPHGRTNFTEETLILFYWDGPPDPEVVE